MSAELVVTAGADAGQVFRLDEGSATIGRGEAAHIRVADPAVSRAHCTISISGGKAIVSDAGSRTGTRINGKAIIEQELRPNDVINVGTTKLRYQVKDSGEELQFRAEPVKFRSEIAYDTETLRKLSGTSLSHFEIGDVAGVGNSGVVFRARDVNEQKEVALKVYLPTFATDDEELQRFIRAVKTMLPIRHPNLVTLYGGGKTGPYCWMAMEYVQGENLTQTIERIGKEGKIDWRPALHVAIGVARGLFHLHSEKIIHRNLSPTNVLFSRLGVAKMGSLVLAKALSGANAREVTMGNNVLGEVRYQAPEQVGAGGGVDGRADIYALGALVYALLTGNPPFNGKNPLEIAAMILKKDPVPPRKINPSIPEALEELVLNMLAKRAIERPQSAGDLLADLEKLPMF